MVGHVWYLSERLVNLPLSSSEVAPETKRGMLEALEKPLVKGIKET